jgi:hypothetical protein
MLTYNVQYIPNEIINILHEVGISMILTGIVGRFWQFIRTND